MVIDKTACEVVRCARYTRYIMPDTPPRSPVVLPLNRDPVKFVPQYWNVEFDIDREVDVATPMHPQRELGYDIRLKRIGGIEIFAVSRFYVTHVDPDSKIARVRPHFWPANIGVLSKLRQYELPVRAWLGAFFNTWDPVRDAVVTVGLCLEDRATPCWRSFVEVTVLAEPLGVSEVAFTPIGLLQRFAWWIIGDTLLASQRHALEGSRRKSQRRVALQLEDKPLEVLGSFKSVLEGILRGLCNENPEAAAFLDAQNVRSTRVHSASDFQPLRRTKR